MNSTITLEEYLNKGKEFFIPNYQRGYVWGKKKKGEGKDSVTYIMENSLVPGFQQQTDIFIQGITVSENDKQIVLIDGQQRTTFLYLLLKYLGYENSISLHYGIRNKSNEYLSGKDLLVDYSEKKEEEYQDIYFFKKTLRIIENVIGTNKIDKNDFRSYILKSIKFLYIVIPEDKATKVFSMMNGNKAEMKSEELIKAEVLRLASLNDDNFSNKGYEEKHAIEWDNNMLRSRYAREWDKWLQWWNRNDVKSFYKINNVMGLLISTYQDNPNEDVSFGLFRDKFLKNQKPIDAKKTFDGLRRLQKRFEDVFNTPILYNKVGAIIRIINDKGAFISWLFNAKERHSEHELDKYYKYSFLNLTHKEISEDNGEKFDEKFELMYNIINNDNLYLENAEDAFRLLLRLNIDEDNLQEEGKGRKFDFSIWDRTDSRGRSLEHIFPKSKVYHIDIDTNGVEITYDGKNNILANYDNSFIDRASCCITANNELIHASEHSIGNLVLLYKDDNSSFNNSSFQEKKETFFKIPNKDTHSDKESKIMFKSRHLLHTIYKFANTEWIGKDIATNKFQTLNEFKTYYGK